MSERYYPQVGDRVDVYPLGHEARTGVVIAVGLIGPQHVVEGPTTTVVVDGRGPELYSAMLLTRREEDDGEDETPL